jgi:hypothetical protein
MSEGNLSAPQFNDHMTELRTEQDHIGEAPRGTPAAGNRQ